MAYADILVVDDDPAFAAATLALLAAAGHRVDAVESAEAALEAFRATTYRLVLCDLQLPGRSGLSLLKTLRDACPGTVVVLITGQGSIRTAVTALKRGAAEFLCKPVRPARLLALTRGFLSESSNPIANRELVTFPVGTPMEAIERQVILKTLAAQKGNKTAAAEVLGISRRSIYNKLAAYTAPPGSRLV